MKHRSPTPLAELLTLALPTVAQMASYTFMQFIDIWMLSRLGDAPPTAAANSGILAFSLISFGMGILIIVNTLVSQSFGRGDLHACGRYLWQGIWLALIFGLLLLPLRHFAAPLFRAFGHPPSLAAMEATYFRIVLLAAAIKLASTALGQFSLGIDRPNAVSFSAMLGVAVNALAAWCLVLGHLGFHSTGIVGAAWAQNIGVCVELLTLLCLISTRDNRRRFGILNISPRWRELLTLVKIGVPSGLQWFSDILAWSIFCNAVIALLGPAAMAANTFMLRYMTVSFLPAYGFSTAVTALVGRYIGRQRPDIASQRAHLAFAITSAYIALCGAIFILGRHCLMRLFTHDPRVIAIGATYLVFAAIYEMSDSMYIIYSGALRGAGDTFAPTLVMTVLCWSITVAGGYAVARWAHFLGYGGPWIVACIYGIILGLYMLLRFTGGRWRTIRLEPAPGP